MTRAVVLDAPRPVASSEPDAGWCGSRAARGSQQPATAPPPAADAADRHMGCTSAASPPASVQASGRWPGQSFACDSSQRSRAWNRSGVQQTGVRTACAVPDSSCSGCSWWWACASLSGTAQLSASIVVVKACTRDSSEDPGSATGRYWRLGWPILGLFELPMYQRFMKLGIPIEYCLD